MARQHHRSDWLSVVIGSSVPEPDPGLFIRLPVEILLVIFSLLKSEDLKRLRLTCKLFREVVPLRFDRVYLSPNPSNIEAFMGIASNDAFCHTVLEIVYDDAVLDATENPERHLPTAIYDLSKLDAPFWYEYTCARNRENLEIRKGLDVDRPDHVARARQLKAELPLKDSWAHYQELLRQQDKVLASDTDVHAFIYGLERFTRLKRVVITPAAHGFLFSPLHKTPMIRKLPYGFNYSVPRGWPSAEPKLSLADTQPWDNEQIKKKWRGFCFILRLLAEQAQYHNVLELVLDVNQLRSGINCHIFDYPSEEYSNLVTFLKKPGFRRLDLPLIIGKQARETWRSFRSGLLRRALSEARDMREFSLETSLEWDVNHSLELEPNFIPLSTISPLESWQYLTRFKISRFFVVQSDLMSFLIALPPTLRSVELSFLMFLGNDGCYWSLLNEMHDQLDWAERDEDERPLVSICTEAYLRTPPGRGVWLDDEIEEFLYYDGLNPFGDDIHDARDWIRDIGVERDAFEPAHERPNVDRAELVRMGILAREDWPSSRAISRYRYGLDYHR